MTTKIWLATWIVVMTGVPGNATPQSIPSAAYAASAVGQQQLVLAHAPELRSSLLNWEQYYSPSDVKQEIKSLRTGDALEKAAAAMRLGRMGPRAYGAILALIETFNDRTPLEWKEGWTSELHPGGSHLGNTSPANEAADALGKIGKLAVEPLIQALKDKSTEIRTSAAAALGKIRDKAAVEPLTRALKDEDSEVRVSAADALGKIGDKATVEALSEAMRGGNSQAAIALGDIGGKSAVEALIQALAYGDSALRMRAALALGEIGDESAIEPLNEVPAGGWTDTFEVEQRREALRRIRLKHPAQGTDVSAAGAAATGATKAWQYDKKREGLRTLGVLVLLFGVLALGRLIFVRNNRAKPQRD